MLEERYKLSFPISSIKEPLEYVLCIKVRIHTPMDPIRSMDGFQIKIPKSTNGIRILQSFQLECFDNKSSQKLKLLRMRQHYMYTF